MVICQRHECRPVQFNLAILDNDTTRADGSRLADCVATTLGEELQISPRKLPVDWEVADRLLRQFKQLRKLRSVSQKFEIARHRVDINYEAMAPSAADHRGKIGRASCRER